MINYGLLYGEAFFYHNYKNHLYYQYYKHYISIYFDYFELFMNKLKNNIQELIKFTKMYQKSKNYIKITYS